MADDIQSWDTTAASSGQLLQTYQAPYDTLIRQTPDGELVPMLATSWEYDESLTELTLELESGVTFSDGEAFDAEAVQANLEYFAAGQGPQTSQLAVLDSVEVVDEDTVTVRLSEPDPALLTYFSGAAGLMASPAAIEAGNLATEPVGTGAYVLDTGASVVGSQYVLTAREDYWAPDLQVFSDVEFIYLEDTALVNALISGQVDSAYVEFDAVPQVEGAGNTVIKNSADWEGLIIFDRDGQLVPALADPLVRQAINHAIDRDAMNEGAAGGVAEVTTQIFGAETGAYVGSLDEAYPYDPERAQELLADAGYPDGFEMSVPVPGPLGQPWALMAQYLGDIGITVNQESVPFENYRGDIAAQQYPMALFRYNLGDPWGTSIRNYISTNAGVWNPFQTQTAELDELLSAVQNGGDEYQERAQAVNEYVVENAWFVPLFRPVQNYAFNPETVEVVEQAGSPIPALYNFTPATD
ncbi:ABC transporter substrate-binding protein [Microbacterium hominis]|uniref:ABC transporter substrate-binding protein n=1 Tax=Microbacterium hominis TaxID=162426 RepID=A0A7D4PT23_9MICO|nr:ABC transporter substrate-binding protein [Microbacterium hominis]QKJ18254.1 ABC transporter substrate-binding protein [Microbacterium hominis]